MTSQTFFARNKRWGLNGALLVTVPVPQEFEVPAADVERALHAVLQEAESQHIAGRELTPFLLSRMAHVSAGATLKANIALLENNARVAAQVASSIEDADRSFDGSAQEV